MCNLVFTYLATFRFHLTVSCGFYLHTGTTVISRLWKYSCTISLFSSIMKWFEEGIISQLFHGFSPEHCIYQVTQRLQFVLQVAPSFILFSLCGSLVFVVEPMTFLKIFLRERRVKYRYYCMFKTDFIEWRNYMSKQMFILIILWTVFSFDRWNCIFITDYICSLFTIVCECMRFVRYAVAQLEQYVNLNYVNCWQYIFLTRSVIELTKSDKRPYVLFMLWNHFKLLFPLYYLFLYNEIV